ncbi:MAG: SpoIID/LytB domain protein, partial [Oscillospiraceae bacterium]
LQTGSYPQMSYCTPDPIIKDLVRQVCNQLIYYNGNVINASYHAASGGYTQSAEYVWSASIGYLKAVESKYDNHNDSFSISSSQLKANLFNAGIYVNGDPSTWIDLKNATFTDGNFIDYITICGQTIRGRTLRERVLGSKNLKSCKIVDVTYSNDTFTFYTNGFGHGVGLSQLGALGYS